MPTGRARKTASLISLLLLAGIFLLSSLPASALPGNIPDIIPHCLEYALLAFFFIRIWRDPLDRKTTAAAGVALLLLAFLDELHQSFVPGRFCKAEDLLFDALGIGLGLLAYRRLEHWSAAQQGGRWARWLAGNWFCSGPGAISDQTFRSGSAGSGN